MKGLKYGAKKKIEMGIMPEGFDYGGIIEPDFYGILKEEGLPTARKKNGDYWDKESQNKYDEYRNKQAGVLQ